jgi:Protein of unknown function (DUF3313)
MSTSPQVSLLLVLCVGLLAGCATTQPVAYKGLASASGLAPNPQKDGHVPFRYSGDDSDWSKDTSVILDPVAVYSGPDQQFGNTSEADKTILVDYMQRQFAQALKTKYALATAPGPNTLRIHVTLTGVETTTRGLSPLTKIAPVGLVINSVKTALDKQAWFTGSVSYAVEIEDSASNRLLRAYVSKQYPAAENVAASFGTLDASKAGIRNGAQALLKQLH